MYTHALAGYTCPFCLVAAGTEESSPYTRHSDVLLRNEHITAFVAPHWWPNNPGHALVIPNRHIENIYTLTPDLAVHIHEASRQIALAMKRAYDCDGISTRQHNEPAGNQHVWHYHLHVFPRYTGDQLYDLTHAHRLTTPERLRAALSALSADDVVPQP